MLPGKTYTPDDILKILRKRFWVIVLPWAAVAAGTAAAASRLPDLYRSTALIQVVPPQVPDSIVRSLSSVSFNERLQNTQQTVLSRTRLENIIKEFGLYQDEQKKLVIEVVVDRMKNDIKVTPVKGDAFTVQYTGRDPITVMKVTERLASYFKDESVRSGELRAQDTNSFVESAVELARLRLVAIEQKLKDYKMHHPGELPTQLGANMQAIQTIQMNLNAIAQSINNDTNNQARLEREIDALEAQAEPATPLPPAAASGVITGTAAQRLAAAKATLAALQARRLAPDHPDIKSAQNLIRTLEKEANEEALRSPVGAAIAATPPEQARLSRLASLRDELDMTTKRIATNQAEEKRLRGVAVGYQAKIDLVPAREADLVELTREYDTQTRIYTDLLAKRESSSMSVKLELSQQGQQFNLIDAARVPEKPFSPDRVMISFFGLMGGIGVGFALVALLEYRDNTFKTDSEIGGTLALPVLAVVPLMLSDTERRAQFRRRLIVNLGLGGTVAVLLAVCAYSLVSLR